jgi:serine/threonine protein kinase/Tol biopolymer transport system component
MTDASGPGGPLPDRFADRYRFVSELGAGGMGEVRKAIDLRLNRPVAIKAIARSRLQQPGSTERLRAEALAAASLDHPYVCRVYELLEDGPDTFIVMEFIEGETLADVLRRGAPPITETVRLASEIAEGLAAAHGRGLVHRDIKPSNVMVTHGHVKILDFGLARPDVAGTAGSATRTAPAGPTAAGAGTPHYMAPEQATGAPITARADLFALGVVMFQCLTGELPFDGATGFDYVHHLLTDAPRPLHRLAASAPDDLVRLIEQCLEKTPARRPESAAAVLTELRRIAALLESPGSAFRTAGASRARRRRAIAASGVVAAGLLAAVAWNWFDWARPTGPIVHQLRQFTTSPGEEFGSRFSPDGQWVSYIADRGAGPQLFVQRVDAGEPRSVTLPAGLLASHVWSPDGQSLACLFWQGEGNVVQVVPAFFGGAPTQSLPISKAGSSMKLLGWHGQSIYLQINDRRAITLYRLDLTREVLELVPGFWTSLEVIDGFDVKPDGTQVVFAAVKDGRTNLWIAGLDAGPSRQLTDDNSSKRLPIWGSGGTTVIYQSNLGSQADLWELSTASGSAQPRRLTSSPDVERPEAAAADGSILYQSLEERTTLWKWDLARARDEQLTQEALSDFAPTVSRDGRLLAFQRSTPVPLEGALAMDSRLFVSPMSASGSRLEPREIGPGFAPRLSPDGHAIAYLRRTAASSPGTAQLLVTRLDTDRTVTVSPTAALPSVSVFPVGWPDQMLAWSPASDVLYFVDHADGYQIRRYHVGDDRAENRTLARSVNRITDLRASADGRKIGYLARTSGTYELRTLDVESGRDAVVAEFPRGSRSLYLGWTLAGTDHVVLRSADLNDDDTHKVEILVLASDGARINVWTVDRAVIDTVRLAAQQSTVYLTRVEAGVHNVFALSLASGVLRRISDNALLDVTFAGAETVGRDVLLGVRDERKSGIWLLDSRPAPASNRGPAGR